MPQRMGCVVGRGFRLTRLFRYNWTLVWLGPHVEWAVVGKLPTGAAGIGEHDR